MNTQEQQAILTIALLAAFADGQKADSEREAIRQIADSLGHEPGGGGLARLYQDVLLKRATVAGAVAGLSDPAHRQLAYEMAVCVCEADGQRSAAEATFLSDLKARLVPAAEAVAPFERQEAELVQATRELVPAAAPAAAAAGAAAVTPVVSVDPARDAALDKTILNHALLAGALELLPQSWASMAIIPVQIKLVHAIGVAHGVTLDQGHIKEFLAAAGVGMTSQYLEQFGRKLLGGLLGKAAGRTAGRVGGAATGMAMSFATTYALGQVARRYYAGGRTMNTAVLRDTFQNLLGPARDLQTRYLPQIREKAATLDAGQIMNLVRNPVR
ncbi:YcjF family protein [Hydrogenophaga sp. IBVHS2]|uniref:YcjF family protein n=1 Tax=Hydrogenophaga sp. IBVHS2 TaxID=1985170 RepID=UPI000A2DD13D|nr:TerB family tellurite resistance protein [Hydrogenophaga sp. IBVHS2]OSZ68001.1 GTPase [Hydrogenophaga sp. IBVHS2]